MHFPLSDGGEAELSQVLVHEVDVGHCAVLGVVGGEAEERGGECVGVGEGLGGEDGELVAREPEVADGGEVEEEGEGDDAEGEEHRGEGEEAVGLAQGEAVALQRECVELLNSHRKYSPQSKPLKFTINEVIIE
jgi:hypothetical protein